MEHFMNLNPGPFAMIRSGEKTIELRLYDEKRQRISTGDTIVFTNTASGEKLRAGVQRLHRFPSFAALYAALPLEKCGYTPENIGSADPGDMDAYYSPELQEQYGVLGIELTLAEEKDGVYLEKMSAFSRMLRLQGLLVGPQETADACTVLSVLGFADKEQVKTALRTVFAKSREEQATFDRVFDGFFISEEAMRAQAKEQMQKEVEMAQTRARMDRDLQVGDQPLELTDSQQETYAAMPESVREKLRSFLDRYRDSAARNPSLYSNFIHSVFAKTLMEEQIRLEEASLGCDALDPEVGLLFRDISQFQDHEIPKAISIIQTISQQINAELSAKRKNQGRGKLDFRKTIRKGLETGGSFYRLRYKKKRQHRRHLVILCDVSGSMIQFSEFALRFIQSLSDVSDSSRVFLFSEELSEADAFSLQNMDMFRDYVRDSGTYGRGTDLGKALQDINDRRPAVLNDATTLLILSDTKTADQQKAMAALLEAKRLAGRIIWLNPIPESRWPYLRSANSFASVCTMLSCNTLHSLAEACRRLAQR